MVLRKPESGAPQQALREVADLLLVDHLPNLGVGGEEHKAQTAIS